MWSFSSTGFCVPIEGAEGVFGTLYRATRWISSHGTKMKLYSGRLDKRGLTRRLYDSDYYPSIFIAARVAEPDDDSPMFSNTTAANSNDLFSPRF